MSENIRSNISKPLTWLIIIHLISLVGLKLYTPIFQRLIPLNIIITFIIVLYYQKHWNIRIIGYCFLVFVLTFIIESVAYNMKLAFGVYKYGYSLGPKILNTPIVIGLLWLLLIYCVGIIIKNLKSNVWISAAIASLMLVLFDVMIEPVAVNFEMWNWKDFNGVPLANYIAWFAISYPLIYLLLNLKAKLRNDLAPYAFCVLAGYFAFANFLS